MSAVTGHSRAASGGEYHAGPPKDAKIEAPARGRRRFASDVRALRLQISATLSGDGKEIPIVVVDIEDGDDDGTLELTLSSKGGEEVAKLTLLISDTTEYPDSHTFYAFSSGASPAPLEAINAIPELGAVTLHAVVLQICRAFSHALEFECDRSPMGVSMSEEVGQDLRNNAKKVEDEDEDMNEEDDGANLYDDDDNEYAKLFEPTRFFKSPTPPMGELNHGLLATHFRDIHTSPFHLIPSFIPLSSSFALCITTPLHTLTTRIPPRSLNAWDSRLLSSNKRLALLITGWKEYPPTNLEQLKFRVGLIHKTYKPSHDAVREVLKTDARIKHPLNVNNSKEEEPEQLIEGEREEKDGSFRPFSLSPSLEDHLNASFVRILQARFKNPELGWGGAEVFIAAMHQQPLADSILSEALLSDVMKADKEESSLMQSYDLPPDLIAATINSVENSNALNVPFVAFSYLLRRLTLCTHFCLVCHARLPSTSDPALKPYVCTSKLCEYQYYAYNFGPSLEYMLLAQPSVSDLLISFAYIAAARGKLDPLPTGLGLRVRRPLITRRLDDTTLAHERTLLISNGIKTMVGGDTRELHDFDALIPDLQRSAVAELLDSIPSMTEMKHFLTRHPHVSLRELDPQVLPAAWTVVRWIIGSCMAHIEELILPEERVPNFDSSWKQFRFLVGAPDAEARFQRALNEAKMTNENAKQYPVLYGFHGSSIENWHSIVRNGLWLKKAVHGRSYGNGVYFALNAETSLGAYSRSTNVPSWHGSVVKPFECATLAEIVNLPDKFVNTSPYLVVRQTDWILTRYLLVKTHAWQVDHTQTIAYSQQISTASTIDAAFTPMPIDPTFVPAYGGAQILIPPPDYALTSSLERLKESVSESFVWDADDEGVWRYLNEEKSET